MFDYFRNCSAIPIKFPVKIVQLKVFSQSDDLALHSRSKLHLKLDNYVKLAPYISDSI